MTSIKVLLLSLLALLGAIALHAAGPYPGNDADHGVSRAAGTLDAYTGNLSFQTQDLDVPGAVGLHGLSFGRIANSRLTRLESHFGLGHNWSHNWHWNSPTPASTARAAASSPSAAPKASSSALPK